MLALEFHFPAGRYHATPWDHHVNEGWVEWPPSPWRIARALLATWYRKAQHLFDEDGVRRLLDALSTELPHFRLPPARAGHTRHYMPMFKGSTTKVFDAFLRVHEGDLPEAALIVTWPGLELSADEGHVLEGLLDRMGYLGRAESWVDARRIETPPPPDSLTVIPHEGAAIPTHHELTRLLAPRPMHDYREWRARWLEARHAEQLETKRATAAGRGGDPARVKLSRKEVARTEQALPSTLWDALAVETSELRKRGWSQPPGSRWVEYLRPRDALDAPRARPRPRARVRPTVARFAVTSRVKPRLTEALRWGAAARKELLDLGGRDLEVFHGHEPDGSPLRGHRHAHLVPEANHRRGVLTHLSIYAPMGFDDRARRALDRLRRVWATGRPLELLLLGIGEPEDFGGTDWERGKSPMFATSGVWESRTPFVPTRHGKRHRNRQPRQRPDGVQIDGPEDDLRRLLRLRGFEHFTVQALPHALVGGKTVRWLEFATHRRRDHGDRAHTVPCGFRISFDRPVRGPVVAGYGAHFGLGVFLPTTEGS